MFTQLYLDSEPLRASGWPRVSRELSTLLDLTSVSNIPVNVPEAVVRELEAQHLREFREHRQNAVFRKVRDLMSRINLPDAITWNVAEDQISREFQNRSTEALTGRALRVIPLSQRPLTEYFEMLIKRQPPFSEDGRGLGDALILLSVIDDLRARGEEGAIVTADRHFSSVKALARQFGVQLQALDAGGVHKAILSRLADAAVARHEINHAALMRLLDGAGENIKGFVAEHLEITAGSSGLLGSIFDDVQSFDLLESVKIDRISTTPQLWKLEIPNSRVALSIGARAVFVATLSRWPTKPPRVLRVGQPVAEPTVGDFLAGRVTMQELVERSIQISANVRWIADAAFDDLNLESVVVSNPPPSMEALNRALDGG